MNSCLVLYINDSKLLRQDTHTSPTDLILQQQQQQQQQMLDAVHKPKSSIVPFAHPE